ncbi:MAG: hypothetical protein D6790_18015 [Caldilineae bacterium]|nr:MAG: hypothetical protein D6790_18015 [Caldilineae bacterium]
MVDLLVFTWFVEKILPPFGEMVRRALALDPQIFRLAAQQPTALPAALGVVALASLSEGVGQSIVLFINRVRPRRFVLALLLSAFSHTVGYIFWSATIWALGVYLFGRAVPYHVLARAVGLAYAPHLLGFFVLTPYLGALFSLVIAVWSLLATVVAAQMALNMTVWQAVACSGLGWLLVQVWRRTLGRPVLALERWAQRRAAGAPLHWTLRDVSQVRLPPDIWSPKRWRRENWRWPGASSEGEEDDRQRPE